MNLKRKIEAVSPVIATILMVAITVVLAAVLYVMVINVGSGGGLTTAPVGGWSSTDVLTNSSAKITFGDFHPEVTGLDIKVMVQDENENMFNLTWSSIVDSDNYTLKSDNEDFDAFYHDFNYEGGQIGNGDYITLYGLKPFTNYNLRVFHFSSDSVLQMAGDTSFQTVP